MNKPACLISNEKHAEKESVLNIRKYIGLLKGAFCVISIQNCSDYAQCNRGVQNDGKSIRLMFW